MDDGISIPNAILSACEKLSQNTLVMLLSRSNLVRLDESDLFFEGALSFSSELTTDHHEHHGHHAWWEQIALLILTIVVLEAVYRKGLKRFLLRIA